MSLAHLHMTYAAAASNNQNGRLLFNHNNLTLPGFHSNSGPGLPSLSNHHQHLLNAANFHQYQSQQSYLNYQQQYTGATVNNNNNNNNASLSNPTPTRSNFAIHDLLGLNNNQNQSYFAPLDGVGAELVCSPNSSSSLSHLSNYGATDRFNDSPIQQAFTASGEDGKKINSVSSDTSPSSSSTLPTRTWL